MEIDTTKKKVIIGLILVTLVILCAVIFSVIKNTQTSRSQEALLKKAGYPVFDPVTQAGFLPATVEAKAAFAAGEYEKAYLLFKEAASSTDDFDVRSVLEISAAGTFMNVNRKKGAEYFTEISNNVTYSNLSRGFALLQIAQFYKGNRDIAILEPYFKGDPILKKSVAEIEHKLYTDIYTLHPYGIAGANIARYELAASSTESKAKELYIKYSESIDTNIQEMRASEGMRQLVPNTYMAKAALYRDLYAFKVVTKEQVIELYELADKETKVQNNQITQQFNTLRYADFLAEVGDLDKMTVLIVGLNVAGVSDMVTRNLSTLPGSKKDYSNLAKVFEKGKPTDNFVNFFKQFNW